MGTFYGRLELGEDIFYRWVAVGSGRWRNIFGRWEWVNIFHGWVVMAGVRWRYILARWGWMGVSGDGHSF